MPSWRFALADPRPATGDPARADRLAFLTAQPFAHRGLHDAHVPENSIAAVKAAIAAGHGIEIDVQISRDDVPYVIHDVDAARMTGVAGLISAQASPALGKMRLGGNGEPLPRLAAVLAAIGGRAPLLIEAKATTAPIAPLCLAIRRAIEGYRGPVAVMSFDPRVGAWFANHAPRIVRGLVVTEKGGDRSRSRLGRRIGRHLALWHAKPDFLAYDVTDLPSRFAARQRRRGLPVLTWTVRSAETRASAARHADQIIYERR